MHPENTQAAALPQLRVHVRCPTCLDKPDVWQQMAGQSSASPKYHPQPQITGKDLIFTDHCCLDNGQDVALRAHCVHTAPAEAGILTQKYLSPDWLHSEAAKPT